MVGPRVHSMLGGRRLAGSLVLTLLLLTVLAVAAAPAFAGWEEQASGQGGDTYMESFCCLSASEAWAGGSPGMVLRTVALLESHPHPTEAEILEGLDGSLCRCCGYPRIMAAVRKAEAIHGTR